MKRWIALLLCAMILWSLVGCGKQEETTPADAAQTSEEDQTPEEEQASGQDDALTRNEKELTILEGESFALQLLQNGKAVDVDALWSSEIPAIVEVDENGVIKGIKMGVAEIKVLAGAQVLRCRVVVQTEETRLAEEEKEAKPDGSVVEEQETAPSDDVFSTSHALEGLWSSEMTAGKARLMEPHVSFTCILPNHTILRFGYRYLDAGNWTADGEWIVADLSRYCLSVGDVWIKEGEGTVTFGCGADDGKLMVKDASFTGENVVEYLTPYRVDWFKAYDSCVSGIETYQEIGAKLWGTQLELNQGFGTAAKLWEGLELALYSRVWHQTTPENRNRMEQEERSFLQKRNTAMKDQETEGSMAGMNMATASAAITKSRVERLLTMLPDAEKGDLEYILPTSDSEYLTEEDIASLSRRELWLARNEIYARHGHLFSDSLREYFESKSWYEGKYTPAEFDRDVLNRYEVANIDLIKQYEIRVYGKTYSE